VAGLKSRRSLGIDEAPGFIYGGGGQFGFVAGHRAVKYTTMASRKAPPVLYVFEGAAGIHPTPDGKGVCSGTYFKLHCLGTHGVMENIYKCVTCERELRGNKFGLLPHEWEKR
jgi:hypothetical protein